MPSVAIMADIAIYLEPGLLDSARGGRHNFLTLVQQALTRAGHDVSLLPISATTGELPDHSLVHMGPPVTRLGLTFRRAYHYPFWRIEASDRRWAWDVARTAFDPTSVPPGPAANFQKRWRKRLYDLPRLPPHRRNGHIYVPLQGRLTQHRTFQSMSPLEMIETTLRLDPKRKVIATLHPKETYGKDERRALKALVAQHKRLSLDTRPPAEHLRDCAYVVTQNSAVAFDGFLFNRPAILFARIDFHHIAQSVVDRPPEEAFAGVLEDTPDYAAYVFWFWQMQSINAGLPDAVDQIADRLRALGWPM